MNMQTTVLYFLVLLFVLSGLVPCWRSGLQLSMKLFWSGIIITLPGAGTLFYLGYKDI